LELQKEFQLIKKSEAYKTINDIGDWNEYFAVKKGKLTEPINELED
jgi:hypothetical protein